MARQLHSLPLHGLECLSYFAEQWVSEAVSLQFNSSLFPCTLQLFPVFSINMCVDSAYMFFHGYFRMKNPNLKLFEDAGLSVELVILAKGKFDNGSALQIQLLLEVQAVTKLNNCPPKLKITILTLSTLI